MLGPVYNFNPSLNSPNKIPKYYDQHLFIFDFSRSLIHAVQFDANGAVVAVKRFWDQTSSNPIANPIDLKIGPDGAFYFLGWGDNGAYHDNGGLGNLVRLDYIGPADPLVPSRPVSKPMASEMGNVKETWRMIGFNSEVELPVGAKTADFFDLRGARVWTWKQSGAIDGHFVELPHQHSGLLRMKISFE